MSFYKSQISKSFLSSMISANQDKLKGFLANGKIRILLIASLLYVESLLIEYLKKWLQKVLML